MSLKPKAVINLSALRHNLGQVKQLAPSAKIMAVIKADAYGHGIERIASTLIDADGLAIARLDEARALRQLGINSRLLLLSDCLNTADLQFCSSHNIDIVLHNTRTADLLLTNSFPKPINIWFKHDSGMHRLGLEDQDLIETVEQLKQCPQIRERFYMTHFSAADDCESETTSQIERFKQAVANLPSYPISQANSAAVIRKIAQPSDWVRPGIMLYGANPIPRQLQARYPVALKPVMTLIANVIAIHSVRAGERVGYNGRWQASRDSRIATVNIGYGDGYPRHAGNNTPVRIGNQTAALVGTVSMDMITVDITNCRNIELGDEVMLWGEGLPVEDIATCAGTISYELLTSISKRVERIYIE